MATSDEVIFAWAIGKVLLILTVALGLMLFVATAGTRRMLRGSGKQRSSSTGQPRASFKP
jgi:hypothetical protein